MGLKAKDGAIMASVNSWALPVALLAGWALLREVKDIDLNPFDDIDFNWQLRGTDDLLEERSEDLQVYEQERVADYQRIEAERASTQLAVGNYGTVDGSLGAFTGQWEVTEGKAGDSCHVIQAGPSSSAGWKMFTGSYCRNARAAGLLPPQA